MELSPDRNQTGDLPSHDARRRVLEAANAQLEKMQQLPADADTRADFVAGAKNRLDGASISPRTESTKWLTAAPRRILLRLRSCYEDGPAGLRSGRRMSSMTKALTIVLVVAFVIAGCSNGAKEAGPVPTETSTATSEATTTASTESTSTSTTTTEPSPPLCSDQAAKVKVLSQQGAAGTIQTTWRVKNTSPDACRSFGYPGMDFHTAGGWLDVHVHRGGSLANIDQAPARVVLQPGESLYFVSYWSDVDTDAGPCKEFDRVKVTLPDNFKPAELAAEGCLNPKSVRVGPVLSTRPT
jgi:Domain of unknown function (DUF4232)